MSKEAEKDDVTDDSPEKRRRRRKKSGVMRVPSDNVPRRASRPPTAEPAIAESHAENGADGAAALAYAYDQGGPGVTPVGDDLEDAHVGGVVAEPVGESDDEESDRHTTEPLDVGPIPGGSPADAAEAAAAPVSPAAPADRAALGRLGGQGGTAVGLAGGELPAARGELMTMRRGDSVDIPIDEDEEPSPRRRALRTRAATVALSDEDLEELMEPGEALEPLAGFDPIDDELDDDEPVHGGNGSTPPGTRPVTGNELDTDLDTHSLAELDPAEMNLRRTLPVPAMDDEAEAGDTAEHTGQASVAERARAEESERAPAPVRARTVPPALPAHDQPPELVAHPEPPQLPAARDDDAPSIAIATRAKTHPPEQPATEARARPTPPPEPGVPAAVAALENVLESSPGDAVEPVDASDSGEIITDDLIEEVDDGGPTPPPPPASGERAAPPRAAKPPPAPRAGAKQAPAEASKPKRKGKPWFEEIFDEDYLRTLPFLTPQATQAEAEFVEQSLELEPGAQILDVGCGYGRHAMELAARGYHVVALDSSLPLLLRGADEAQRRGLNINFVHGDMRELSFDAQFDGAYCLFSTFGYFDDETNKKTAQNIARALKPGGRLVIEILNRDYLIGDLPSRVWWEGDGCVVLEEVDFNYFSSRIVSNRSVVFDDGRQLEQEISMRAYSLHEFGKLLHASGFRVLEISGGMVTRGRFFGNQSREIIVVAEKRAPKERAATES